MKIKFLGAAGQVTGSSFLLTSEANNKIVIDSGMFQGSKNVESLNHNPLNINVKDLAGIILTHAHLDHCGRVPVLVKNGFNGPIWMTPPTKDITEISLFDTAHINEEDNEDNPLYTKDDVIKTISLFKTSEYAKSFAIGDFVATFRDAGHILGSAFVEIVDKSSKKSEKIVFSGDLGNSPEDLIKPTELVEFARSVVIETTYGDRLHPEENIDKQIEYEINEVEKTGSTLLIPTFSIERSQEIVHRLSHMALKGIINPGTQVYFDSPMGERVTEVFEKYTEYYNKELSEDIKSYDPFHFEGIHYTKNSRDSRRIVEDKGAKVIIAGSGMMTGGRIINHAKIFLPLENTRLLFVGYQAEGTLGRTILEGAKTVKIDREVIEVKATVNQIESLSSHADQSQLLRWLGEIENIENAFLVHGEDAARNAFAEKVKSDLNIKNIFLPNLNDEIQVP